MEQVDHFRCYEDGPVEWTSHVLVSCPCACHPLDGVKHLYDWADHAGQSCERHAAERLNREHASVEYYRSTGQTDEDRVYGRSSYAVLMGEPAE